MTLFNRVKSSIFTILIFSCSAVTAAPQVQKVDLPAYPDQSVTVSGRNFGDFGGVVVSWDDFEKHSPGDRISGLKPEDGHTWSTIYNYRGAGIAIDTQHSVSGDKSVKVDWSIDPEGIRAFGWAGKGPYNQLYITYWRLMQGNFLAASSNHKQFYLYGNKGGFPQGMPFIPAGQESWGFYNNVSFGPISLLNPNPNNKNDKGWTWNNTNSKNQRWEFFIKLNEPYTERNGIIRAWLDGSLGIDNDSYQVRNVDGEFSDFRLGHMAGGFFKTAKAWFDDIYIATTQARVEICNSRNYDNCTIKHIQYVDPAEWTDTTIKFRLRNMNAFKGSPVYLYVIDKNGVTSAAVPLARPKPPFL